MISSSFSARFKRSSSGHRAVPLELTIPSGRRQAFGCGLVVAQRARLVDEHDRDAVADRVGQPCLLADQLLGFPIVAQRRRFDALALVAVTDGLNRLFSNSLPPVQLARDIGLAAVNRFPALKRLLMRDAMGILGDLPRLVRGEPL